MKTLNFDRYIDILLKTREQLTNPKNWCSYGPGKGDQRCLAITILSLSGELKIAMQIIDQCEEILGAGPIGNWNDSHTHEEVLELLDTAIAQRMQIAA